MDCRKFSENHCAFVDDTLPGIELVRMQMHLTECEQCARHDATVRRSLMLFRNLPRIEPSAKFSLELERKLREARAADQMIGHAGGSHRVAVAMAVTSAVILGYIGVSLRQVDSPREISFPPVVASAPALESLQSPMTLPAPAMVAAVPAGLPIWTAALFAEQTFVHFASAELASSSR